jgi:hypothetical protein
VDSQVGTNVSQKHTDFTFRAETLYDGEDNNVTLLACDDMRNHREMPSSGLEDEAVRFFETPVSPYKPTQSHKREHRRQEKLKSHWTAHD